MDMNSDIENKIGDRIRSRRIDCRRLAGATSLIALAVAAPAWAQPLQVSVNTAADAAGSVSQDQTSGQSGPAAPAAQQVALPSDQYQSNDIIVTGIIGSLQRNLDAKREAPGVVDVISR